MCAQGVVLSRQSVIDNFQHFLKRIFDKEIDCYQLEEDQGDAETRGESIRGNFKQLADDFVFFENQRLSQEFKQEDVLQQEGFTFAREFEEKLQGVYIDMYIDFSRKDYGI